MYQESVVNWISTPYRDPTHTVGEGQLNEEGALPCYTMPSHGALYAAPSPSLYKLYTATLMQPTTPNKLKTPSNITVLLLADYTYPYHTHLSTTMQVTVPDRKRSFLLLSPLHPTFSYSLNILFPYTTHHIWSLPILC